MKRRVISLLLVLTMVLSLLPESSEAQAKGIMSVNSMARGQAQATPWDGETAEEPEMADGIYQIGSAEELAGFANLVNSMCDKDEIGLVKLDAVLTADVDLGDHPWTPIGNAAYITQTYAGTFDGQNHTISGLKIEASAADYGLFGKVNTGTIKNVKVEGNVTSNNVVGGIIGKLQTGTVENCSMSGSVQTTGTSTKGYIGGIVGKVAAANAAIRGCCNTAAVSGVYAGGILGHNTTKATIEYCYNTGEIVGTTRSGGIAGQQSTGNISYCYSIGKSTNGIAGFSSATIENCYYLADNTSDDTSAPGGTPIGSPEAIIDADTLLLSLNSAESENMFCEDTAGINQGYPVLLWQLASSVISVPVTSVEILGDIETGSTLTAQAIGADGETATNVAYQWAISEDQEHYTDIEGAVERSFVIPDTADYVGKYLRVTVVGEQESTAFAVTSSIRKSDALLQRENEEKVQAAKSALSLDVQVVSKATTLRLPEEIDGCSVRWTSDQEEIISNCGVVTLPEKDIVSVTLTAEVMCGTVSASKQFTIDVWAEDIDPEVYLAKVLDSLQWDFKLLQPTCGEDTNILMKLQALLQKKGYDGITVTIQSTADEGLVSKNGKIFYPLIPEGGSFADGKQVQIFFGLTVGDQTVTYPTTNQYALLVPWNTDQVQTSLETAADEALTPEAICGDNSSLSDVVSDLTLPSYLEGEKFSVGLVQWSSSDEKHLAVEDGDRTGSADAFYNPYLGKVYQDQDTHEVTLTATVTNPSTDVTITRTFQVTILPMSEEQLNQTIDTMTQILRCYTADKLVDYTTKETLDTTAVRNDIGLVLPKDVLTAEELASLDYGQSWDYWNYKFTVTSSDTEVIEVNSFRAFVYRPLGENADSDKQVTLHVTMESKSNPNLSVAKDIAVTVAHLGREEINQALELMDQAKVNYANGLLGNNTDVYSIIDNLTPYQEIVWNAERTGVEFVYRNADRKNNGIVVDTLPGWEAQEDWRLFHTSNKNLLSNETLILNETPAKDTFVKIDSVLTDATFGKYYAKFQNDETYDAETLIKWKQLYKQPVNTYVVVVGAGNYTQDFAALSREQKAQTYQETLSAFQQELDMPITVSFTLLGLDEETIIDKTEVSSFVKGATVFDVFRKVLADHNIEYTAKGSYVSSIQGLAELEHGAYSGWMYTVGDVFVNSYMNAQELSGGEDIVVRYVTDYRKANLPAADPTPPNSGDDDQNQDDQKQDDQNQNDQNQDDRNDQDQKTPDMPATSHKPSQGNKNNTGTKTTTTKKKKTIKKLKILRYKRGTKKIVGKTLKKAKVVVKIGKRTYQVKANKKGRFTVKLKKKLKRKNKVKIRVTKSGYRAKTKIFRVK